MTPTEIANKCPIIIKQITKFLEVTGIENDEALIYALAQVLHDKLNSCSISDIHKGQVLSDLLYNFMDLNKEQLALYRQDVELFRSQTNPTFH